MGVYVVRCYVDARPLSKERSPDDFQRIAASLEEVGVGWHGSAVEYAAPGLV